MASYNSRLQMKTDTEANWLKATNFSPLRGEIIVYSDLNKIKIGDGVTNVNNLDFLNHPEIQNILDKIGSPNGIADLDENGMIPANRLETYILNYPNKDNFPIIGEPGKIYISNSNSKVYIWNNEYVDISSNLILGNTSTTAFRGDYGQTAYNHANNKGSAFNSGLYKITTNSEGHVTDAVNVQKSDITALGIDDGADGVSPTITTTTTSTGHKLTITDVNGIKTVNVNNGISPTITTSVITGGHKINIADVNGSKSIDVIDGVDGVSPIITSSTISTGHRLTIVDADGTKTVDVDDGLNAPQINDTTATTANPYSGSKVESRITDILSIVAANGAAAHNAIFRGKNLTNVYTIDEICARISDGTFRDLFVGDYFDITISSSYASNETVRCILAGFDVYYMNGDTPFTNHHAVIVPKNCLSTLHQMNSNNVTTGGFKGSAMWSTVLPAYNTAFGNVFGSHLLTHRTLISNSVSTSGASMAGAGWTGYSNNWEWIDTKLSLLNEVQLYGCTVLSSSLFEVGCDNLQLPLFRLDPRAKIADQGGTGNGRTWYWLRSVVSAATFCDCAADGASSDNGASDSRGARPLFCIG